MFSPQPKRKQLTPIADLLTEALTLYFRGAAPFIATATLGALAGNLFGLLANPASIVGALLWGQLTLAVVVGMTMAPTTYLVVVAHRGERPSTAAAIGGLVAFGPRFFAIGLIVGMATGLLTLSVVGIVLAIYLAVRATLAGPAVIVENQGISGSLIRSWRLIDGRWWRTLGVQLIVGIFGALLLVASLGVGWLTESVVAAALATAVAQGIAAPLFAAVELLMFEEYREAAENEPPRPPLEPGSPPESDESPPPP